MTGWRKVPIPALRATLRQDPVASAYAWCNELTRDAECYTNGSLFVVDTPSGAHYQNLPRTLHSYAQEGTHGSIDLGELARFVSLPGLTDANGSLLLFFPEHVPFVHTRRVAREEVYVRHFLIDRRVPAPDIEVGQLGEADRNALASLYGRARHERLSADLIRHGLFVGHYVGTELVAAMGAHFVNASARCAMFGFLYVDPAQRGRKIGAALSTAMMRMLCEHADTIVCDIEPDNHASRRIHEPPRFGLLPQRFFAHILD